MSRAPAPTWSVRRERGLAADLHAASSALVAPGAGAGRSVRVLEATDRCVVLGSTQQASVVDPARLAAAGWSMTRRSSGGAAVVVGPGEVVWVDVVVPAGDPWWVADVGRAGWWLGDAWARALGSAGRPAVQAWHGGLVRSQWSDLVCFAGLGPGEVTAGGRKVVGLSQRRTRQGALFQCALLVRWAPGELLDVLALPAGRRRQAAEALADAAVGVGPDLAERALTAFLDLVQGA